MARSLVTMKVTGFAQALDNLKRLDEIIATTIVKKASRAGGNILLKSVRARIYDGLSRRTGLLASGLSINVGVNRGKVRVSAYIKEREIKTAGKTKSAGIARAAAWRGRKGGSSSTRIAPRFGAFYWRFLELGVAQRQTSAGANRGALPATRNVRAAFTSAAGSAIDTFRRVLIETTESEVNKLPKG